MCVYKLADGEQIYRKISFESGNLPEDWNKDGEWEEMSASCFRPRVEGMMGSVAELSAEELDEEKQKRDSEYSLLKSCEGESFHQEEEDKYFFIREVYGPEDSDVPSCEVTEVDVTDLSYHITDIYIGEGCDFETMEEFKRKLKPIPFEEFVNAVKRVDEDFLSSHREMYNKSGKNKR
ncbi:MAG: hypothetical protein LUD72_04390 [Bacteroidales bacterium]|nr:hypothetical protein [Bacteroidales bacterium]